MENTIGTLTSKEDSLARQFLELKDSQEKLDIFSQSIKALHTSFAEEKSDAGIYYGKVNVYLKDVLLGTLNLKIPTRLNKNENKAGEASFSVESIDYVRVGSEERNILHSLGDRLKIRVELASNSPAINIQPDKSESLRRLGEREQTAWRWTIENRGTQDARLILTARLVNDNSAEIPIFKQEHSMLSSNLIRQVRNQLLPIPLAVGGVGGFLLFGIVGIFRHTKKHEKALQKNATHASHSSTYTGRKQL
jgi:hypothetical protein